MADGTHHGSLNDTGPAQGAALTLGQDLSGDLAALDLGQLMGLDVIIVDPSAGGSSLPGEEDLPTDLMDLDLDQLMGIDVTSDAPLPRPNTDTFSPLPPTTADDDAPNGVSTPPAALSPAPSPIPAAIVGAPGEGTVIEDVLADASGGDDGVLALDELGANARNDDLNHQGPQGEEASLDLVGLDLETLMEIAVSGIGAIEDIANEGDASLDGGAEFDIFDLGSLAPALGQPLSQFSAGLTGETTETSPVVESDDTGSGGDTTTTTTDPGTPTPPSPPNNAPTAAADGATTNEDTAVVVAVLGNDSDVDGDSLSVSAVTQGANGSVVINGDNTVTYTPNADFNGADSFTYTIDDGNSGSDTATVSVTVNAVNDAPAAAADSATTNEDTAVVVAVLGNDSDVDGDSLSVSAVTQGANGAVVINGDNTVTYIPNADFNGADSFTYTVSDGNGGSDTATVNVTVNAVNDAPATNNVAASGIDQVGSSNDPKDIVGPTAGIHGDPQPRFLPECGDDCRERPPTPTPTTNNAPEAVADAAATTVDTAVIISVLDNDSDVDGDTLKGEEGESTREATSTAKPGRVTRVVTPESLVTVISLPNM